MLEVDCAVAVATTASHASASAIDVRSTTRQLMRRSGGNFAATQPREQGPSRTSATHCARGSRRSTARPVVIPPGRASRVHRGGAWSPQRGHTRPGPRAVAARNCAPDRRSTGAPTLHRGGSAAYRGPDDEEQARRRWRTERELRARPARGRTTMSVPGGCRDEVEKVRAAPPQGRSRGLAQVGGAAARQAGRRHQARTGGDGPEAADVLTAVTARRVVILGAAGRDFHNFNVVFRDDPAAVVVAFTATQMPGIAGRRYPASMAGPRYPVVIPIEDVLALEALCRREHVDTVVFAYSDVTQRRVMELATAALACGADFTLLGPGRTMLPSAVPVVAVSAVRTGCGKSPIARWVAARIRATGRRVAVVRHPMPYSDLERQRVQRFATPADLDAAGCTVEEREEYEPHLAAGGVVFAGVDYAEIVARAAAEADVIVWDGGNNDFPFVRPDLHVVVVDALRPEDSRGYHPGEAVLRTADVIVVNKVDTAGVADVRRAEEVARSVNPRAPMVRGALPITIDT